jgi:hypothetical protein
MSHGAGREADRSTEGDAADPIPGRRLAGELADLAARVPYLQATALGADEAAAGSGGGNWVSATAFHEPGGVLATLLGPERRGRLCHDRRVAASSFFQGAALRVLGTGVGLWLMIGRFPDVAAASTAYALEVDLPARLALVGETAPGGRTGSSRHLTSSQQEWFADRAFAAHLDPLADAVRREVRIGEHTLWGNAAAALAGVVLDVVRSSPAGAQDRRLAAARQLLEGLPHRPARYGDWADIADGADHGVFWTRRTCCLWYLEDPERRLCDTCNLLSERERRARLVAQLARRRPAAGPGPGPGGTVDAEAGGAAGNGASDE